MVLGEIGEGGDARYLIFPIAAISLIIAAWALIHLWQRRRSGR
jgi:hypothetical protein